MPSTLRMGSRGPEVRTLQTLLNRAMRPSPNLVVDGIFGQRTYNAVVAFQRQQGLVADGIVGPLTWAALERAAGQQPPPPPPPSGGYTFPFRQRPSVSYHTGARYFGAPRSGGSRAHAACDLIFSPGTPILAVGSGTVILMPTYFYEGTYELQIRHADFVVRYGEISSQVISGISLGATVRRGQHIANVGRLNSGSSMLHFEMYRGNATGSLTQRENRTYDNVPNRPYQRRRDLLDPTPYLDRWGLP